MPGSVWARALVRFLDHEAGSKEREQHPQDRRRRDPWLGSCGHPHSPSLTARRARLDTGRPGTRVSRFDARQATAAGPRDDPRSLRSTLGGIARCLGWRKLGNKGDMSRRTRSFNIAVICARRRELALSWSPRRARSSPAVRPLRRPPRAARRESNSSTAWAMAVSPTTCPASSASPTPASCSTASFRSPVRSL